MLTLNSKQVRYLRSAGHTLNPVVMIGNNGLSETVLREIDRSLNAHELIKIKVAGDARELRLQMLQEICDKLGAAAIQHIGKQLVIYRPAAEPKIILPKN
jgi:RNA-binding protein